MVTPKHSANEFSVHVNGWQKAEDWGEEAMKEKTLISVS